MYLLLLVLFSITSFTASASGATCQASISALTSNAAASSYCSSALASVTAASGDTVTSVVIVSKTTTDLGIPTSTITIASTTSIISKVVSTTYVASSAAAERRRRRRRSASTDTAAATSLLSTLDTSDLSAACSCIGALPTGNAALKAAAPTTTITGEVWFTVGPATTISTTQTVSTTEKSTVTLAAPTFDQVWGPKSGCADISYYYVVSYVNQQQTQDEIFQSCKDGCAESEDCAFLFIQNELPNVGTLTPFWNCFYNNHTLDESEDLDCTKDADEWGDLYGFDAVGRG